MKKIMVRADDLGYSMGVNFGIARSVADGIITSVGFMTNMPDAEHGLALLKGTEVCLGQHTNICVGRPLTNPDKIPSITNKSGEFRSSKEYREAKEDFVVLEEAILEIEAQYQRFLELTGEQPEYFEGHAIESNNFFKGLEIVAKKYGLKYSGFSYSPEMPMTVGNTKVYMHMESMFKDYDPFKTLKNMVENAHEDGCDILVCHPGYLDAYILRTSSLTVPRALEVEMACDPAAKEYLEQANVQIVTYRDL